MDTCGVVRIGTNLPDKKVFMNLRRLYAEIQMSNGGLPITEADRIEVARKIGVRLENIKRMEPRVFATDIAVSHTDATQDDEEGRMVSNAGIIAVEGGQGGVEVSMDQREIMQRIAAIVEASFDDRDLEIIQTRLEGDMTREKFDRLVAKYNISVERVRQIQRAGLLTIKDALVRDGIADITEIAC